MKDYIIIVSHPKYDVALDTMLASLQQWSNENIIIVKNNSESYRVCKDENTKLTYVYFPSNLYEYSAYLVPKLLNVDPGSAFLLLHDTCQAGPSFATKIQKAFTEFRAKKWNILWCSASGQCNICIFDVATSFMATAKFSHLSRLDKMEAIHMEHDRNHPNSVKSWTSLRQKYADSPSILQGIRDVYSSGVGRHVLSFPFIDLEKYYVHIDFTYQHPQHP